jgi:hypothetical protein
MKKIFYILTFTLLAHCAMAKVFGESAPNYNASLIDEDNYLENMFAYTPMGGGTQVLHNFSPRRETEFEKLFEDGTWNAWGGGTAWVQHPLQNGKSLPNGTNISETPTTNDYAYGASIWGQTGRIGGFALGAQLSMANPFFASNMNGAYEYGQYGTMPSQPETALNQLYVEYQYENRVQADVGWITINESPWLVPASALGHIMPAAAYQGGQVTVYAGDGWLLHGIAFNAAQLIGQSGFTGMNFYNSPSGFGNGLIPNAPNSSSSGTVALGANYKALNNNLNVRLWGYSFQNYDNLLYADSSLDMHATDKVKFNISLQAGNTSGNSATNGLTSSVGTGQVNSDQISSNIAGAMGSVTIDWAQVGAAYTTMWGPEGSFGNGQFVSPYTPAINTDPIFTNSWNYNNIAVNSATSQGIKAFAKFTFLDGNLWINPTYATYTNTSPQWDGTQEWDLMTSYSIPQVKGLNIFNVLIYEIMPASNPSPTLVATQIVLGYTY